MKTIISLLILLIAVSGKIHSQENLTFLDYKYKATSKEVATFLASVTKVDSLYRQDIYFAYSATLHKSTFFIDSMLRKKHGTYHEYYNNGMPEILGEWNKGKKTGIWLYYNKNGIIVDSFNYINDKAIGISLSWYDNGFLRDSMNVLGSGASTVASWFSNGNPSQAGHLDMDGKKVGTWVFYHSNGNKSSIEKYEKDTLVTATFYDEAGNIMARPLDTREAQFSTQKNWKMYLEKKLMFPQGYEIVNAKSITVIIKFWVDENGKIVDPFVYIPFHPAFDKAALDVIKKSPAWLPAISHNRKIAAYHLQPITFGSYNY